MAAPATAQLWVVCLLAFLQFLGVIAGRMLWPVFFRGKDPQVEFFWANGGGFVILAVLCFVLNMRLGRLRFFDALFAFALGVVSSAVGMGWGILDGYGR